MFRRIATSDSRHTIEAVLVSARQAIDLVCDRWTLVIVMTLLPSERKFNEVQQHTGMATRLLTTRLRSLEEQGIVLRMPYSLHPLRHDYRLTNMGRDLAGVIAEMLRWEARWAENGEGADELAQQLFGQRLTHAVLCRSCLTVTDARQIDPIVSRSQIERAPTKQLNHRRSTIDRSCAADVRHPLGEALDIFGDKWGIEVLICSFFRLRRFGDIRDTLGISGNILTDRLQRLTAVGVLEQMADPPTSRGYRLTEKGIAAYAIMIAVHEWADRWVRVRYKSPVKLIHRACGKPFLPLQISRP